MVSVAEGATIIRVIRANMRVCYNIVMRKRNGKRILLLEASMTPHHRKAYDGVFRYADKAGWEVQPVEYSSAVKMRRRDGSAGTLDIREQLRLWKPDGVILECGGRKPTFDLACFGKIPFVVLHSGDHASAKYIIEVDNIEITAVAVRELLRLGFDHYAYMPYFRNPIWSEKRKSEFERLMGIAGKGTCRVPDLEPKSPIPRIIEFLRDVPKPCGVMAANDEIGFLTLSACRIAKLKVPEEVAVVGVDNDVSLCENSSVTLSSVAVDHESGGILAAKVLDAMMSGRRRNLPSGHSPVVGLVRRESTSVFHFASTAAAVERIRRAHGIGLTPLAVAAEMKLSRRMADVRFVSEVGHSVFEEIRRVRVEQVKLLLRDGKPTSAVADECGYRTPSELCRDFRKVSGLSPRAWLNSL